MFCGLPQGFVRFGSTAHLILLHLHEIGDSCAAWLSDDLMLDHREISANLGRLSEFGFIFPRKRVRAYPTARSSILFSLRPRTSVRAFPGRQSGAVRSKTYRERKRARALARILQTGILSVQAASLCSQD
jgi:hypothetical protein